MLMQIVTMLANMAFLLLIAYVVIRILNRMKIKALPDFPPAGGRIRTAQLKTIRRGGSQHYGFGNRQSAGFIELSSDRFRTGRFIRFDVAFAEIESVTTESFGRLALVKFDFNGRDKSLVAKLGKAKLPPLLNYLRSKSVPVPPAESVSGIGTD
jgi:hypothetical protein